MYIYSDKTFMHTNDVSLSEHSSSARFLVRVVYRSIHTIEYSHYRWNRSNLLVTFKSFQLPILVSFQHPNSDTEWVEKKHPLQLRARTDWRSLSAVYVTYVWRALERKNTGQTPAHLNKNITMATCASVSSGILSCRFPTSDDGCGRSSYLHFPPTLLIVHGA